MIIISNRNKNKRPTTLIPVSSSGSTSSLAVVGSSITSSQKSRNSNRIVSSSSSSSSSPGNNTNNGHPPHVIVAKNSAKSLSEEAVRILSSAISSAQLQQQQQQSKQQSSSLPSSSASQIKSSSSSSKSKSNITPKKCDQIQTTQNDYDIDMMDESKLCRSPSPSLPLTSSSSSRRGSSQENSDSEELLLEASTPSDEGMFSGENSCCLSSIPSSSELSSASSTDDVQSWPPSQKGGDSEHEEEDEEDDGEETSQRNHDESDRDDQENDDDDDDVYDSDDDDDDRTSTMSHSFRSSLVSSPSVSPSFESSSTLVINGRQLDISSERYAVLTFDQVIRLDSVMDQVMTVNGRGNFPTLDIKLKDLVRVVKSKLILDGVCVRDIRLNGGAASFVLSASGQSGHSRVYRRSGGKSNRKTSMSSSSESEDEDEISYTDLDLIFGVDLSNHRNFDKVRSAVLDSLLDFLPIGVNKKRMSSLTLKEAYVHKMVKVTEGGDRWSLISLCNNRGRDVEIKFVDTMKRQFEFSVDSFQIILDSLLLFYEFNCDTIRIMTENMYPTVVGESVYGNFNEALRHLKRKVIATRNPEEIRGGGLLKYCRLQVLGYKPTRYDEIKMMEKYMCSRFFIDFSDINVQRMKLVSYLSTHFGDNDCIKYDYLMILYDVVDESTVCLMGHERRQTLALIDEFARHFYFSQHQPQIIQNHINNGQMMMASNNSNGLLRTPNHIQTSNVPFYPNQPPMISCNDHSISHNHHQHNNNQLNLPQNHSCISNINGYHHVQQSQPVVPCHHHAMPPTTSASSSSSSSTCVANITSHNMIETNTNNQILMTTTSNGTMTTSAANSLTPGPQHQQIYYTPIHHQNQTPSYHHQQQQMNLQQATTVSTSVNQPAYVHHHHYYVQQPQQQTQHHHPQIPPPLIHPHPSTLQQNPSTTVGCLNCGHCGSTVWMSCA